MPLHPRCALAGLAVILLGCGAPPAEVKPPATPAAMPAPPPADAAPAIATQDGWVRVPRPRGDGWECRTEHVEDESVHVRASYVQCRRRTPAGVESLMAKDYEVPPDSVMSAEALSTVEYPRHYRKRWAHVTYKRSAPVVHHGQLGYEVAIDLAQESGPVTHMVERVVVVGTHTLNLSADGPADSFPALSAEAERWFEGAQFAILRGDPARQARLWPRTRRRQAG